ncbi:MAG: hypothetical protein XE11_1487 [Methanomicrobiales archaeon 53_19]|jgi:hypothetical protein|uniref:hypothetical protein n=1 Tax=Methanocalculus sp. TaxID=2004547 RepID=UPI000748F6B0|nr:hypothetical protein [Methanocalculus sp.]KUK69555.1 MAG: hypothetical protein XD88_1211 [Methanocalculus sp. 52_23]KUL03015.1 MAG: hypothetical protein XE11_1487 [Methanomicrobiales archaeon 53_19]HIJ06196.1 hypothetical protein [Methanocalculus sp.]
MDTGDLYCTHCRSHAIITQHYSGQKLCREHFIVDLEAKAKREIRRNLWLRSGDRIGVALDGGPASAALLTLMMKITEKRSDIELYAIYIDEEGKDSRRIAEAIAAAARVSILVMKREAGRKMNENLAECASGAGITTIACGKNLDEEAEAVFKAFVSGDIDSLSSVCEPGKIRWIYPLETIPAAELWLYAALHYDGVTFHHEEKEEFSQKIQAVLGAYTARHPSTLYAVYHIGRRIRSCISDTKQ